MSSCRAIDYLMFGVQLPTTKPQLATLERLPAPQVVKKWNEQSCDDSDDSTEADFSPAPCQQQLAGASLIGDNMDSSEASSLVGKSSVAEQDENAQADASTPRLRTIQLPMSAWTRDHTPEPWNCPEVAVEDTITTSSHGRGRTINRAESSLGDSCDGDLPAWTRIRTPSPTPQSYPYSWGACAPPPPLLSHVPRHIAPMLRPMTIASAHPALLESASGEAVVSTGSAGHPFCCAQPCKYYTKSKKGCKDGDACKFCHLCKWTKSCRKSACSSPVSA
mmetsp:Transcript_105589/g.273421  ORF Transcript_105589/g.273421 Transcript_105589/m.273421 type:complete len:277 (+) Transcript_105589:69-899(+)